MGASATVCSKLDRFVKYLKSLLIIKTSQTSNGKTSLVSVTMRASATVCSKLDHFVKSDKVLFE
jgi:hypothetical protein